MSFHRMTLALLALSFGTAARGQEGADYLGAIRTEQEFDLLSAPSKLEGEVERTTKYLLPASGDPGLLAPLFQNVERYPFHREFLAAVFPGRFPGLTVEEYRDLVERRATRRYFAGSLSRLNTPRGDLYGFTVFTNTLDPSELLSLEETRAIVDALRPVFDLRPLVYAPPPGPALLAARQWKDADFVYLRGSGESTYQAYTRATGFGFVRLLTLAEFEEANRKGRIARTDILVLDRAPGDIEGVVAGVVTAVPQEELSHLAIRTARRGTPNAYLDGARAAFAPLAGKLIRFEVRQSEYRAVEATLAEAEAWWAEHRPRLSRMPTFDADHAGLDSLREMDLSGNPVDRFGGKAVQLARLQRILEGPLEKYREVGFAIPMRYFLEFLRANRITVQGRQLTYENYLRELFATPEFQSSPEIRFETLENFRNHVREHGVVSKDLVSDLTARVVEIFQSPNRMVRFRSSSNLEDDPEFNGAGLYESTSVCVADNLDGNTSGPSRCDTTKSSERTVERALKKVWSSLWTFRAVEERAWYQVPQEVATMGVLVSRAFLDERANGVAFTGNPANSLDRNYLVTVQKGEASVVNPAPGVVAEKNVLEVRDGKVVRIERSRRSSLVPPGEFVMSGAELEELGAVLWHMDRNFPVELAGHRREDVLLDVEFKVEPGGELAIKQVRPFLHGAPPPEGPTFELVVPENTTLCGVFADGRSPRAEFDVKSQIRLVSGRHELPTVVDNFGGNLLEEVLFGSGRTPATPVTEGRFRVRTETAGDGVSTHRFSYEQDFRLAGGELLEVELLDLEFEALRGEPVEAGLHLDEAFITDDLLMVGVPGGDRRRLVRYSSCSYTTLPRWDIRVELEDGNTLGLEERSRVPLSGSAPANLMGATVRLGEVQREVRDYWRLVYAALHHNERVRYWVVLDDPVTLPGVGAVRAVEIQEPQPDRPLPALASYLDESLDVVSRPTVSFYWKGTFGEEPPDGFRRGDADGNGRVNITDVIFTLSYLFRGGPAPGCLDAADVDDDGIVEIADPIILLSYLFRGVNLLRPPGPEQCGRDPTTDSLQECRESGC